MRFLRTAAWLVALLLGAAGAARAQEVQVPFDSAGRVQVVDARLAERLGLFADRYPGLQEVRVFQGADSSFVLEVTTLREGRTVRQRVPLTREEVLDLRRQVTERVAVHAPATGLDQEGRYLLLGQTSVLGFAFYGPMVPYVLGAEDASTVTGLYLLTAGASFFVPYVLTQDQPVTRGMAALSGYGASRGILHGLLLHQLVAGEEDDDIMYADDHSYYEDDEGYERASAAAALLGSIGEGVAGYAWARNERMTPGQATAIGAGGDFGLLGGMGTAYLVGGEDLGGRGVSAFMLAGSAAGIWGGHELARRRDYTAGDVSVGYTAGVVGGASGFAVGDLLGLEGRPLVAAGMLGAGAGLYVGDRLVRDTDFTVGQATLNALGTAAGGLVGLGAGILIGGDDIDETGVLTSMSAGAVAGFAATYRTLAPAARAQRGDRMASWKVRVDPRGVMGLAGVGSPSRSPVPVVGVQYRF